MSVYALIRALHGWLVAAVAEIEYFGVLQGINHTLVEVLTNILRIIFKSSYVCINFLKPSMVFLSSSSASVFLR